jgi:hypothetical protein
MHRTEPVEQHCAQEAMPVDTVQEELAAGAPETGQEQAARPAFTLVPDWVMLCERIPPTAFRLWCILRSMQFERGPGIPPLTVDQVCWLLPGVNGKPTSRARAREALTALLGEGLLLDVSAKGTGRSAARTYVAQDRPDRSMGWSGARRKLGRYWPGWRG